MSTKELRMLIVLHRRKDVESISVVFHWKYKMDEIQLVALKSLLIHITG